MTLIITNFCVQPSNLLAFVPFPACKIRNLLASTPLTGLQGFLDQFCHDHGFGPQDQIFLLTSGMNALREADKAQYNDVQDALISLQFARHTQEVDLDHWALDKLYTCFDVLGKFLDDNVPFHWQNHISRSAWRLPSMGRASGF